MGNPRILLTAGCSFTQIPNRYVNWPVFLRDYMGASVYFDGAGSAGNDFISKRILYRLHECLTVHHYKPEDMLVGVMWSGADRKCVVLSNQPVDYTDLGTDNRFFANPNTIAGPNNHYLMNAIWDDELTQAHYKHFSDDLGNYISTIENILRVQWFLKLYKIKYFFTTYHYNSFNGEYYETLNNHPDVKYLFDQVDLDHFLPIQNMDDWNRKYSGYSFEIKNDNHPTTEMSKAFVDRVIVPHLKSKGYIS